MNQREKDWDTARMAERDDAEAKAFCDGAEYARKELFERLVASADDPMTKLWLKTHAKEYGL